MKLQSGHTSEPLEGEELKKQMEDFTGYPRGLVRLHPGRWLFPTKYTKFGDKIFNFKFRSSDVVVMTYPKCGTTWTQEIIWNMVNNPDLNHPSAQLPVMARSPFLDFDMLLPDFTPGESNPILENLFKKCETIDADGGVAVELAKSLPNPRVIKVHMPCTLMPPSMLDTCKVVYVVRNPKDVIISYHHHSRIISLHGFIGKFEDFVQYFVNDDLVYGPYWLHVKEAWERRDHPNMHIIFFEDMKANPLAEIKKLNTFLNINLTEAQLENIAKYTSFKEMKERFGEGEMEVGFFNSEIYKREGGFFRKGETGDWKGKFTPELEAKVDDWIKKNMSTIGVNFKYNI
ncbi:Sulfotransferase (sult) [Halocaridina rubra]|uniref:Sulfotransferase (Sult) n=1 Tax=Halocaridina rubra TaxID=373956 RepID=A0AAN9AF06_HALRR